MIKSRSVLDRWNGRMRWLELVQGVQPRPLDKGLVQRHQSSDLGSWRQQRMIRSLAFQEARRNIIVAMLPAPDAPLRVKIKRSRAPTTPSESGDGMGSLRSLRYFHSIV